MQSADKAGEGALLIGQGSLFSRSGHEGGPQRRVQGQGSTLCHPAPPGRWDQDPGLLVQQRPPPRE